MPGREGGVHCGEESRRCAMGSLRGFKTPKVAPPSNEMEARAIKALSKRPGPKPVPIETAKQTREVDPNQLRG